MGKGLAALLMASVVLLGIQGTELALGWSDRTTVWVYAVLLPVNVVLTLAFPAGKARVVRLPRRWVINPPVRLLLHLGVMPLGYALLETRGRRTGRLRRTPVGNGRRGDVFWIIAEHGMRAGYVRNILQDNQVRIRMRVGWRFRWVDGVATVCPELDPVGVQRRLAAWHPLRALNAVQVQVLASQLLVVRVDLRGAERDDSLVVGLGGECDPDDVAVLGDVAHQPGRCVLVGGEPLLGRVDQRLAGQRDRVGHLHDVCRHRVGP